MKHSGKHLEKYFIKNFGKQVVNILLNITFLSFFLQHSIDAVSAGVSPIGDTSYNSSYWDLGSAFFFAGTVITTIGRPAFSALCGARGGGTVNQAVTSCRMDGRKTCQTFSFNANAFRDHLLKCCPFLIFSHILSRAQTLYLAVHYLITFFSGNTHFAPSTNVFPYLGIWCCCVNRKPRRCKAFLVDTFMWCGVTFQTDSLDPALSSTENTTIHI